MNVIVTGRHVEVTDALKKYATDKIEKFERFEANITEANFVFSLEKHNHKVEASLKVNGHSIQADSVTEEMYSSIDEVLDKLGRQIRKMKDKTDSKRKSGEKQTMALAAAGEEGILEGGPAPLIIKSRRFDPKPMTAEEAAMQLDVLDQSFFVFVDSMSNGVNVVYRRKDGNVGLVEPSV